MKAALFSFVLFMAPVAAPPGDFQDPVRVFLQGAGGVKANEMCVARTLPLLKHKLGRESAIRVLASEETAEVVAVVEECATYSFTDGSFTAKGGPTPRAGPGGTPYIDKEYRIKTEGHREYVVTVGLTYGNHLFGVSNDGDEKSLKAAGEAVAKSIVRWLKANRARIRAERESTIR
jgi:hypothetical protein